MRNRRFTSFISDTDSNLVDVGRARCCSASYRCGGTLPGGFTRARLGGHGEGLRRTYGDAAGTQSGSYFDKRTIVNTGIIWSVSLVAQSLCGAGDRCIARRTGRVGRSRRSSPRSGKPVTWRRAATVCAKGGML